MQIAYPLASTLVSGLETLWQERDRAQERFTQVNKAFEVLTNPQKRQAYDLRGGALRAQT